MTEEQRQEMTMLILHLESELSGAKYDLVRQRNIINVGIVEKGISASQEILTKLHYKWIDILQAEPGYLSEEKVNDPYMEQHDCMSNEEYIEMLEKDGNKERVIGRLKDIFTKEYESE